MNISAEVLTGIIVGVGVPTIIGIANWGYRKFLRDKAFPTKVEELSTRMDRSEELHLFMVKSRRTDIKVLRTVLEVVSQRRNNGNVDEAMEALDASGTDLGDLLDRRAIVGSGVGRKES